jgi:hypothetical protein
MSDPTILGIIRRMAGGDENDLSSTILEALEELEVFIQGLGGGGAYSIGEWLIVGDGGGPYADGWEEVAFGLQFTKDSNGWVHIRGVAFDNGTGGNSTVFTLPVGMRPPSTQQALCQVIDVSNVVGAVSVQVSGAVQVERLDGGSTDNCTCFVTISFYAG